MTASILMAMPLVLAVVLTALALAQMEAARVKATGTQRWYF
ncbi:MULTISPECIES: hypothetical protein [Microvirga]|jgi:hypothetical protein|nr:MULTISPECIES: hypothetical protein [Microvirga]